jgi:hypothetical protein
MKKKKIIKLAVGVAIIGTLIGSGSAAYMFYRPHRDVQAAKTDYTMTNSEIVSENYNDQKVILLKEYGDQTGVSATFTAETNHKVSNLRIGEMVTVKGVIRSGAAVDEDLGFYEDVMLEKSDLVAQK